MEKTHQSVPVFIQVKQVKLHIRLVKEWVSGAIYKAHQTKTLSSLWFSLCWRIKRSLSDWRAVNIPPGYVYPNTKNEGISGEHSLTLIPSCPCSPSAPGGPASPCRETTHNTGLSGGQSINFPYTWPNTKATLGTNWLMIVKGFAHWQMLIWTQGKCFLRQNVQHVCTYLQSWLSDGTQFSLCTWCTLRMGQMTLGTCHAYFVYKIHRNVNYKTQYQSIVTYSMDLSILSTSGPCSPSGPGSPGGPLGP